MPHPPYYYDSLGNRTSENLLTHKNYFSKSAYISYLKYTNEKLLELVDYIQSNNRRPAIIILMGDHGFRQSSDFTYLNKYQWMNLNAIFLPDKNYSAFYKGISNVNQFRVILNTEFEQILPLLKDSIILIPNTQDR